MSSDTENAQQHRVDAIVHIKDDKPSGSADKSEVNEIERAKLQLERYKLDETLRAEKNKLEKTITAEKEKLEQTDELERAKMSAEEKKWTAANAAEKEKWTAANLAEEKKWTAASAAEKEKWTAANLAEKEKWTAANAVETHKANKTASVEYWKLSAEVAKVAIWPIAIVLILLIFRVPLDKAVSSLLARVPEATKVTIGDFSIELATQARNLTGDENLANELKGLSETAIAELIRVPRPGAMALVGISDHEQNVWYSVPSDDRLKALLELEEKGLIIANESLSQFLTYFRGLEWQSVEQRSEGHQAFIRKVHFPPADEKRIDDVNYRLTSRGEQAVRAIVLTILNLLGDSNK